MILRLTCPGCNRDAYNASVEAFKPCPYCGILFSGKHGTDKRQELRIRKEIPFVFSHNGRLLEASTVDISERGLCIKIFGSLSPIAGDVLTLSVNGSSVKAQVMWVSNNPDISVTVIGLKMTEGKLNLS